MACLDEPMFDFAVRASCAAGVADCNDTGGTDDGAAAVAVVIVIVAVGYFVYRSRRQR